MTHARKTPARPKTILRAWRAFEETVGVTSVRSERDYAQARETIEVLLDEIGDDESHPLAQVLDYLAHQVAAYEEAHNPMPQAEPKEVLRLLMSAHGLKQADLADCTPQGRISDILRGRRGISKEVARRLARRFNVSAAVFL